MELIKSKIGMNTILFGNGFNYFSEGFEPWESLVSNIEIGKGEERIPFTFQYESKLFLAHGERRSEETRALSEICKKMKDFPSNKFYEKIVKLNFDNYLTTNYDHAIEKAMVTGGYNKISTIRTGKYSIRRKKAYQSSERMVNVWHIHGDVDVKNSIMLGYEFYGNYLSQIKHYIDGKYSYNMNKTTVPVGPLKSRVIQGTIDYTSWIDFFVASNIHIIAYGLYYDEIDLWWLFIKRKMIIDELGSLLTPNKIVYYGNVDKGKKKLLECLGIEVVDYESRPTKTTGYEKMYNFFIEEMRNRL